MAAGATSAEPGRKGIRKANPYRPTMGTKGREHVTVDDRLFRFRFEAPIGRMSTAERFEHGIETAAATLDAFDPLVRPAEVNYRLYDRGADEGHDGVAAGDDRLRGESLAAELRQAADGLERPEVVSVDLSDGVRVTLANGAYRYGTEGPDPPIRYVEETDEGAPPLELIIRRLSTHKPELTGMVDIVGHSDHWLEGGIGHLPESTAFSWIDRSLLAAGLDRLYDAFEPVEISLDTYENADDLFTPYTAIPGSGLPTRMAIEWVLENFERRSGDGQIELRYVGEEIDPLVGSADWRVERFLRASVPDERCEEGATAVVAYPDERAVFVVDSLGRWQRSDDGSSGTESI